VLAESVTGTDRDVVDQLRAAKAELTVQRQQADALAAEAANRRAEAEAKLAELEAAKADQERLRSALSTRIADAQAESAGLAAEDARLTGIIQAREDEARRQAAAQAEAARRAAAPPSTVPASSGASPATGAGTTGTTSPGATPPTTVTRPPTSGGLIWPVAGSVSSEFGPRWGAMHSGIDIWAPIGTSVVAAKGGTVISTGFSGGYGNLVLIDHGGGFVTAYAHLSAISVASGQSVGQGQLVGAVGCTGSCTGPHLHFETRVNGAAQNPRSFLP
jgi:murein DD-endopeptidase MepM/ murein hydrolase activator NlpD